MSNEQREAIEAAIQIFDEGEGAPVGKVVHAVAQEFSIGSALSRTADLYNKGELTGCGECRIRVTPDRNERLKTDGGEEGGVGGLRPFGGEVPHIDDRDEPVTLDLTRREIVSEDLDPKTAHPDFLLGRRVAIDFGSNVREGRIRQVKDHAVQGRWISAKPDQGGMILADPEEHDIEFVEGDDE